MSTALRRIIIKVGTNLLTVGGKQLNRERMADFARQIAALRAQGKQVVLVTSGAVAAGSSAGVSSPQGKGIPVRQILAAIGQPLLMRTYAELFAPYGIAVAQALFTRTELERDGYLNARNTLLGLLETGVLPNLQRERRGRRSRTPSRLATMTRSRPSWRISWMQTCLLS